MELILEILFDLIVEGSVEAVGEKKVPLVLRILAALVLIVVFGGLVGVLLYIGISEKNWIVTAFGAIIAVFIGTAVWKTVKKHRR
jgi:hypothetical protein